MGLEVLTNGNNLFTQITNELTIVYALQGNDTILTTAITAQSYISAGEGNDSIASGGAAATDYLFGEFREDAILGGQGQTKSMAARKTICSPDNPAPTRSMAAAATTRSMAKTRSFST